MQRGLTEEVHTIKQKVISKHQVLFMRQLKITYRLFLNEWDKQKR